MAGGGRRIAFVVNPLAGAELRAGERDVGGIYYLLTEAELGMCEHQSSKAIHDCKGTNDFYDAMKETVKEWGLDDQLIFYYSGHGEIIEGEFCFKFGEEPVAFQSLMLYLKVRKVRRVILIIDSCYAGAAIGIKGGDGELKSVEELDIPKGIAILTSSQASELSHEVKSGGASVFTQLFCKAIANGLDKPTEDRVITVADMVEYINAHLEMDEEYKEYPQHSLYSVHGADRKIWIAKNRNTVEKAGTPSEKAQPVRSPDELRVLYERTIPTKHPCLDASIDDLDWDLVEEFAEAVKPGLISEKTREEALEGLKLLSVIRHNENSFLHKSAVLCFCRQPFMFYPQARAVFIYGRVSDATFVKKEIGGPLSKQVRELVEETMEHLNKVSSISEDGLRREVDEIDRNVIRELISNAIIHRNYEMNGTVQVKIAPEAVEVENPGSFPPNTSWDILMKSEHSSNPVDATVCLYLENLKAKPFEGIGRGFEIFKKYVKENGEDSIICQELAGPAVRVRVLRRRKETEAVGGAEEDRMKLRIDQRLFVWSAIFIAVVSLSFSAFQGLRLQQQGWQLNEEMVKTAEVNNRILQRLDYFEVSRISDKLSSQQANIFLSKWRDDAARRGLVETLTAAPRVYEVSQSGRELVNELEKGLFQWLAERKENYPDEKIEDILSAVNMSDLHRALYKYNIQNETSYTLETVVGILVAYIDPAGSEMP